MSLFTDPVFWVELIMLSCLLAVGLYVTYTDFKLRWVPNRFTFFLLVIGVVGQSTMIYLGVTSLNRVVVILLTALGIALALTLMGFWAPGDAKLFWAVAVALPPTLCPSFDPFSFQATPIALLFNALLGYLLVLLLMPLWRREEWKGDEQERPGGREWLLSAIGLIGLLGLILGFACLVLDRPLSYLEGFASLVVGYRLLARGVRVRYWPAILLPGIVALLYLIKATEGWREYIVLWSVVWLVEIVYQRIHPWYNRAFIQSVPIPLLQAGSVSHRSLWLKVSAHQESVVRDRLEGENSEPFFQAGRPLTEQQVQHLKNLARLETSLQKWEIEVEQAIPFVPFIVAAAILTALVAGNLVLPLTMLVAWLEG